MECPGGTISTEHVDELERLFQQIDATSSLASLRLNEDFTSNSSETASTSAEESQTSFRVDAFARKEDLSGLFPRINDTEENNRRLKLSRRNQVLLLQIVIVLIVFTTNLTLTIYANSKYPSSKGIGLLYEGDCDMVQSLDQWLHLLINLLSTGILGASNYCIQLQAAPTRADVDRAHNDKYWLDIGVLSLRNFRYIGRWRRLCWILLALCSLPLHLAYNSAIFKSLASNDYTIAVAKDSFVTGASWNLSVAERNRNGDSAWNESRVNPPQDYHEIISSMQQDVINGKYETKNISDCFALYDDYFAPQGNGVIFVKNDSSPTEDGSLLMYVGVVPRWDNWAKNMWAVSNGTGTDHFTAVSPPQPVTTWLLGPPRYEVSHCLVQPPVTSASRCRFQYSTYILYTVCVFNFIIALIILCVWILRRRKRKSNNVTEEENCGQGSKDAVLTTLGDAIASFMTDPDDTTKNMCLATKDDFHCRQTIDGRAKKQWEPISRPRKWKYNTKPWSSVASWRQWFGLLFMYSLLILMGVIALVRFTQSLNLREIPTSFTALYSLGFGALTPFTFLVAGIPRDDPAGLPSYVLIVNSLQLLFSMIYVIYNAILSTFLMQREFSLMHTDKKRKPLRVSEPVGIQRSSYFITIPFRYGIPLIVMSGVTHWLISQSFFLARVTALTPDGRQDDDHSFSTSAYSPGAIIVSMIVAFVQVVVIVLLGCRKYDGTMSMVCTNSMAISAACHSLEEDRKDGHQLPVQWGVVQMGDDGVGHCTFTTAPTHLIRRPQDGTSYQ